MAPSTARRRNCVAGFSFLACGSGTRRCRLALSRRRGGFFQAWPYWKAVASHSTPKAHGLYREDYRLAAELFPSDGVRWSVNGSILVKDDVAYFAAGRNSFLDGGIFLWGLDFQTGRVVHQRHMYGPYGDDGYPILAPRATRSSPASIPSRSRSWCLGRRLRKAKRQRGANRLP